MMYGFGSLLLLLIDFVLLLLLIVFDFDLLLLMVFGFGPFGLYLVVLLASCVATNKLVSSQSH